MKCPRCQHENPQGARFCEECASPLARTCSNCGTSLSATAKFCHACAHPVAPAAIPSRSPESYTPKHLAERIINSKAALEGERKQVTVLFADLKGSMELLADRDPEEARRILDPVLERMMEAVHRYGGTVNQVMGDGIMALFGAPLALEDHAIRACYAGLRMQEAVKRYAEDVQPPGDLVQIRVGLNSGDVVVRSIGSDLRMDYTAVGQTTHLAARLEQMAAPGSVLISPETLSLVDGYVSVESLGMCAVKGVTVPIEVYEVVGASAIRSRLQAAAVRGLTKFIGRSSEMAQLHEAVDLTRSGKGQVVAVVGEPGVGKSRLYWEFTHSHRTRDSLTCEATSVSHGRTVPYAPVVELLKAYFAIEPRDDVRKIREKVTGKALSLDGTLEPLLPALLSLFEVQVEDSAWERLDPPQRRQRTLEAVKRLLLRESQVQPLLVVFEDLQWIDGETQAFLDTLIESLPTARLLLLVNYRPEYQHRWASKTYYRQVRVDPLPTVSADQLLDALLGEDPSMRGLRQLLIARTEGNPFFLEEAVRSLVEGGSLVGEPRAYRLAGPLEALRIPPNTQAILASRIDRLDPGDKRVLQAASVLGKEVPFSLLAAVHEDEEHLLQRGLARLQGAEFLYEAQLFPEVEYTFKHALTREVAYASLTSDRRRALHARAFEAMVHLFRDRSDEHAEALAYHAQRAALWDDAARFGTVAGMRAAVRSAVPAAVQHYQEAMEALDRLPENRHRTEQTIDLLLLLRSAQFLGARFSDALTTLRRAEQLARDLSDAVRLGYVAVWLLNLFFVTGQHDKLRGVLPDVRAALVSDDPVLQGLAALQLGQVHVGAGDGFEVRDVLQARVAVLDRLDVPKAARHPLPDLLARLNNTGGEYDLGLRARLRGILLPMFGMLGEFDEAVRLGREATAIADSIDSAFCQGYVIGWLAWVHLWRGDFADASLVSDRGLRLAQTKRIGAVLPLAMMLRGWALCGSGSADHGIRLLDQGIELAESQHYLVWHTNTIACLAESCLLIGDRDRARRVAVWALDLARERSEPGMEAWLQCLLADSIGGSGSELDVAERSYRGAIETAEALRLRPLVARGHLGLGRLSRVTDEQQAAVGHFRLAISLYRDMGMTYWLEKAEAEMRELG